MTGAGAEMLTPLLRRRALIRDAGMAAAAWATASVSDAAGAPALPSADSATLPPPELTASFAQARPLGSGTLRYFGFRVCDVRLWVGSDAPGADWSAVPLALSIVYARALAGTRIAESSLTEMRRQGEPPAPVAARWLAAMKQLFPDVAAGDRLTGVHEPGRPPRFFFNGLLRGEVADADFARPFFGIWLSPQTSEPALRTALLGRAP